MAFQTAITVREALTNIDKHAYLLPAIQRDVVWSREQIQWLFDSLVRGYPIGSFLFWDVEADHSKDFRFYEFMCDYHEKKNRYLQRYDFLDPRPIVGVLDGQQRLTALNIGLRGSHAKRRPGAWAKFDSNYPSAHLYLGLDGPAAENELEMQYDFRFLDDEQLDNRSREHWFKVSEILEMSDSRNVFQYVRSRGLESSDFAFNAITQLSDAVHKNQTISFYLEKSQDLDKVLNIFVRVNRGGTQLRLPDLLRSVAVLQWKTLDAREEIRKLLEELNATGKGFTFSQDVVLKSALALADVPSLRIRIMNFNATNMAKVEQDWFRVATALRLAARLLADFGFSRETLIADSVLLPLAYYIHHRQLGESFLSHHSHSADRDAIRPWVFRTMLKRGIWSSNLDGLLEAWRSAIKDHGQSGFPVSEIETRMAAMGKPLRFEPEELEQLCLMSISDTRAFAYLSYLYPGTDFSVDHQIDHIFPKSLFSSSKLKGAGVPEEEIKWYQDACNQLPNLQLLAGPVNTSKQAQMPLDWMRAQYPDEAERREYVRRHALGQVPDDLIGFRAFFETRRQQMVGAVGPLLGVQSGRAAGRADV